MARMIEKALRRQVEKFNATHSVGDAIRAWPMLREGDPVEAVIQHPGARVSGATAVVELAGFGPVPLTHVWTDDDEALFRAQAAPTLADHIAGLLEFNRDEEGAEFQFGDPVVTVEQRPKGDPSALRVTLRSGRVLTLRVLEVAE